VPEKNNSAVRESDSFGWVGEFRRNVRPVEWPVIVRLPVAGRCFIAQIYPRLSGTTTPVARDLLLWCTPGQPYRVHGHTWSDLSLTDQRLVLRREMLIDFRMLGNALSGCSTTREKQRGGCYPECQRDAFQFVRLFKNLDETSKIRVSHWLGVVRY